MHLRQKEASESGQIELGKLGTRGKPLSLFFIEFEIETSLSVREKQASESGEMVVVVVVAMVVVVVVAQWWWSRWWS